MQNQLPGSVFMKETTCSEIINLNQMMLSKSSIEVNNMHNVKASVGGQSHLCGCKHNVEH